MNTIFAKSTQKRMLSGFFLAAICFAACYRVSDSLIKSALLSLCFIAAGCIQIRIPKILHIPATLFALIAAGITALFISQFVQNEGFSSLKEGMAAKGLLCCVLLSFIFHLISPNLRFSVTAAVGCTLALATANWFVFLFRGSELSPIDFVSLGTAMNVANKYRFVVTANMVYAWLLFILLAFSLFSIQWPVVPRKSGLYSLIFICTVSLGFSFFASTRNNVAIHFGNGGTYYQGYILNFTLSLKELYTPKPEGYSPESVKTIMEEYIGSSVADQSDKRPNIIVIMDEAYSDLSVLGNSLHTSEPVSPFIQSLKKDTIHGYALSSAYGGRTANSEFEFLTGATLGFAPPGLVAYQTYVNKETLSLASVLKSRGYSTIAMHPFRSNGWTRNTTWPQLGFEKCFFLDDFPQKNLMRSYVSDQEMMEYIISTFEHQDPETPLFLFGVTMQNHSSYDYQGEDFTETVFATSYSQDYPDANQYLTLIRETDRATEYLINYLCESDPDTVVVFFGDHLPALNPNFYSEIHEAPFNTLTEQMRHYKVPFFIWANYDIDEYTVDCTSLSYLSTLVFHAAGLNLTPYQQFLQDTQSAIPSINMEGYYSTNKNCYQPIDDAQGDEEYWLNRYQQIQYAYLFDEPNPVFYGVMN